MNYRYKVLTPGILICSVLLLIFSCTKINEATTLGGDLIPAVDNINTFETFLPIETDNVRLIDTVKLVYDDQVALGNINDPEFGTTHGDIYFNISRNSAFSDPFVPKDSIQIDSVILSLAYAGSYGDTAANLPQTVRVYEIAQTSGFNDTTLYKFNEAPFATTGPELGSKTFTPKSLKDSVRYIRGRDTTKYVNILRVYLDTALVGRRFINYDTTFSSNGGFRNDSIFKTLFRGFAVKADMNGNTLNYFDLADNSATKLTIFYRKTEAGKTDTLLTEWYHLTNGQANIITRTPAGGWASALPAGPDDRIYLQTAADGSYGNLKVLGLDTMTNKVIHRAEVVLTRIGSTDDLKFPPPSFLFMDMVNTAKDTAFTFSLDMQLEPTGAFNATAFGGARKADNTYRFNVSRYIQGVITRNDPVRTFRIYAPLRTFPFAELYNSRVGIQILSQVANGRIVLGGGGHSDPAVRPRLRIIYSKI